MRRKRGKAAVLGALVATLAIVALVQLAFAAEGTFTFHVKGAALNAGSRKIVKIAASPLGFTFKKVSGGFTETCTDATLNTSVILGGTPGQTLTSMQFSGCKPVKNGVACTQESTKSELLQGFQTEVLKPEAAKGAYTTWFVSAEPSEVLFRLKFECKSEKLEYALKGSVAGEFTSKETEKVNRALNFPSPVIEVIESSEGVPNEVGLLAGTELFTLIGELPVALETKETWAAF
jgi:hypothetical protein